MLRANVCTGYLLALTPGMQCPSANGPGTNIFLASLLLAQVLAQFEFSNQMADPEVTA